MFLAGNKNGQSKIIEKVKFPVLCAAQKRKGWPTTENCVCRNPNEQMHQSFAGTVGKIMRKIEKAKNEHPTSAEKVQYPRIFYKRRIRAATG